MDNTPAGRTRGQVAWQDLAACVLLAFAAILPYTGSVRHGYFIADDFAAMFLVKDLGLSDLFTPGFYHRFGNFGFIRPVGLLLWKANYMLYGFEPVGYHVTNLLLHSVCAILVFSVTSYLSKERIAGLVAGLIFAVHPLHAEPVNWLSCRYDLLSTVFYLSGFLLYLSFSSGRDGRWRFYCGALLAMSLAVLSKEMAVTFPLALVLYELFYHKENGKRLRDALIWTVPFFALAAGYFVLRLVVFHGIGGYGSASSGSWHARAPSLHDLLYRLEGYTHALFFGLDIDQPYQPLVIGSLLLAASAAGFLVLLFAPGDRKKLALFFGMFTLVSILPLVNFTHLNENYMLNTRYLYLASVGYSSMLAVAFVSGKPAGHLARTVAALSLIVLLSCHLVLACRYSAPWIRGSGTVSSLMGQFKETYGGPLDGLDVTVYNLPLDVFGVDEYVPMFFARALYFTYGCPEQKKFLVKTGTLKPGERLKFKQEPDKGYKRKVVLIYSPLLGRFIELFDSRKN